MGLTGDHIHKTNPRTWVASVKGFGPGPYEYCKVYENVAQCAGGSASTTARHQPTVYTYMAIVFQEFNPTSRREGI